MPKAIVDGLRQSPCRCAAAAVRARRLDLRAVRCAPSPCSTPTCRRRSARHDRRRWPIRRSSSISRSSASSAVELMPVTAWIDERHLPPLGLTNAWGYNPVTFMALDPRLAPGGIAELRDDGRGAARGRHRRHPRPRLQPYRRERRATARRCRCAASTTCAYYRHQRRRPAHLVNDTGTGNTLACDHPVVRGLVLDSAAPFRPSTPASTASASTWRRSSAARATASTASADCCRRCTTIRCWRTGC